MSDQRLLGAVAPLFTAQLENVATESLRYILGDSDGARNSFAEFLSKETGLALTESLSWRSQVAGDDKSRPDLVGTDKAGQTRVIIEAKFWADLTPNQPGTYLKRLQTEEKPGAVVVVGPERRMETLWAALKEASAGLGLRNEQKTSTGSFSADVLGQHRLSLVSWNAVIGKLTGDAERTGAAKVIADLGQLHGLIALVDEKAFLPIRAEELSDRLPRRVLQYIDIAAMAVDVLVGDPGLGLKKGKATAGGNGVTFGVGGSLRGSLGVYFLMWAEKGWTPLWLQLYAPTGRLPKEVFEILRPLEGDPRREIVDVYWGPAIPILLPTGVERSVVVNVVVEQVQKVVELLRKLPASILGGPANAVEQDESVRGEAAPPPQSAT